MNEKENWYVYIILASDQSLYTGIAKNIDKRFEEHLLRAQGESKLGAKYFNRRRTPVKVVYQELLNGRSAALKREMMIKKLTRQEKLKLLDKQMIKN